MRKQKIWLLIMFFLPAISVCGDGVYKKSGKGFRDLNENGKLAPLRESGREHGGASAGFAPTNDVGGKSRAIGSYLGMELLRER